MKYTKIITLFVLVCSFTACSNSDSATSESLTRVKDIVQADVFEILPSEADEFIVYHSPEDIQGEYLELASVELEEINSANHEKKIMDRLVKEAKKLGSNGVLVISNTTVDKDGSTKQEVKAVAVYALDRSPNLEPLAKL